MQLGEKRFHFYLSKIQDLFSKAEKQKNPALWLYQNDLRTPMFMLEGLAKLYTDLHNKKKFTKLKERFKALEDGLGSIDYYDNYSKEIAKNKKIPKEIVAYLTAQSREKIQQFNELLVEEKWIGANNMRIEKIKEKLAEADWMEDKEEIAAIKKYYDNETNTIKQFVNSTQFHFDNVEEDVHELRRKIRWLSIYPQALQGAIQLKETAVTTILKKYLTKEIVTSKYNVMPLQGDNQIILTLHKNNFLAISWIIAELGKLKDNGLRIIAIKEAMQFKANQDSTKTLGDIYKLLGKNHPTLEQLLDSGEAVCKKFFAEKVLDGLVA